jgi:hypothetical protein
MKKIITFNQALRMSLYLIGLLILFHLAILIGITVFDYAPINYLWGGQMTSAGQLLTFEIISMLTSLIIFLILLIRSKWINLQGFMRVTRVAMWVLFVMFLLNTIGNLVATSTFERFFAIATGLLAFLFLRIALEKNHDHETS